MNAILVRQLPMGVRLTAVFDCCHSGSSLDLPFMYYPDGRLIQSSKNKQLSNAAKQTVTKLVSGNIFGALTSAIQGVNALSTNAPTLQQKEQLKGNQYADVIMFSGCKDTQTSADAHLYGQATGAMSFALVKALKEYPNSSYGQLLQNVRGILQRQFHQVPQLSSGRYMDMNQMFLI
jgi:hypothetical protein